MNSQIDLYTGVHKGQRGKFFEIMMKAGTIDYDDKEALDRLYGELTAFKEHMYRHAISEEKFIHPLLSERMPGGARKLEEDHHIMHQQLDDIVSHLDKLKTRPTDPDMRRKLGLEFYRAWNRFISFYFEHINEEEENIQPTLWKIFTDKELADTFKAILSNETFEELKYDGQIMLPAMNLFERAGIINGARISMPPMVFQGLLTLAEQILGPDNWASLKPKIISE